jgi:FkbM family methyltransferase
MGWQGIVRRAARRVGVDVSRYPPARTSPIGDVKRHVRGVDRPVVFDVGANVGQSVRRYRSALPGCEIHSFEPSPTTFEELRANVEGPDVRLVNVAVGSTPGSLLLFETASSVMTSLLTPVPQGPARRVDRATEVPVITLDDYCAEQNISRVDLLKTDTQGYDLEVLRGARRIIEDGRVHLVMMEVDFTELYVGQPRFDVVLGHLLDRGYHLVSFYEMHWKGNRAGWCDALLARHDPPGAHH